MRFSESLKSPLDNVARFALHCPVMDEKTPTSFRLSETARRLLRALAEKLSISQAAVIELALRGEARRRRIEDEEQE